MTPFLTILIVEDDPPIMDLITHEFTVKYPEQVRICKAASVREAAYEIAQCHPNTILINLGRTHGIQTLTKIKQIATLPIIVYTDTNDPSILNQSWEVTDAVYQKPDRGKMLLDAVVRAAQNHMIRISSNDPIVFAMRQWSAVWGMSARG